MQQRRGMNELDAGGQRNMPVAPIVAEARGGQGQHRSQSFAAGGHDMSGQLRDQRRTAFHLLNDQAVDAMHVLRNDLFDRVERGLRPFLARFIQADDNAQRFELS